MYVRRDSRGNVGFQSRYRLPGTELAGMSFERDNDGNPVARVVDAAPFAYDAQHDRLLVRPDGYDPDLDRVKTSPMVNVRSEEINLLASEFRTESIQFQPIQVPAWARGFAMFLTVTTVEGSFASGEGYQLDVLLGWRSSLPSSRDRVLRLRSAFHKNAHNNIVLICHPDAGDVEEFRTSQNAELVVARTISPPYMVWSLVIEGTFENGARGVQSRVDMRWLV